MNNTISAKEYCDRVFDGTHESPKASKQGRPLITSKNIVGGRLDKSTAYNISEKNYLDIQGRSYVSQWDILFSMIGSVGATFLEKSSEIDYAVKNVGVFSCLDEARAKWLYYYLNSATAEKIIQNQLSGAVQKFLSLGALRDFPVPVYDKSKKPALNLLSALDAKIELNHRINAELEGMAKLLYDYWFVQFDFPMSAAQAAALGKPQLTGQPYQSSGGKMTHHPDLKREIPDGWEVKKLEALCKNIRNSVDPGLVSPETPYVGLEHVPRRQFFLDKWETAKKVTSLKSQFVRGDFLFGKLRPYFHKVVRVAMQGICTSEILVIRAREENYLGLTGSILFSDQFVNYTSNQWGGGRMPRADWKLMKQFKIACPDSEHLEAFNQKLFPLWEMGAQNQTQNQHLTALRDWLLPMLMNGQVTVR